jgi:restriction endonuclease S subunit
MSFTIGTDDLPEAWKTKHLGEVLQLNYGKGLSVQNREPGGIPVYGSNGIVGHHNSALVQGPGVIVGRKGSAGEVHLCSGPFYPIDTTYYITPQDAPGTNIEFIYYLLKHLDLKRIKGDVGVPGLNREMAYLEPVSLPSEIAEQKAIAHTLSTVQRAISAQERIIQTTTELKKALMQKLFTEGLRGEPQEETEIGLVPESWEVVPLSAICSFLSGGTPSKQNPDFWQGTIPWVSPKDMKKPRLCDAQDHISEEALESGSKLAPVGSVLIVVRGMILAKTVPVALAEVPMAINQDMKAIVPNARLDSSYLLYAVENYRGNLFRKVGRSGHGTATLMAHEVASMKIPLPNLEIQAAISNAIQASENKIKLAEFRVDLARSMFRSLLHELFSASLRVSHPKS